MAGVSDFKLDAPSPNIDFEDIIPISSIQCESIKEEYEEEETIEKDIKIEIVEHELELDNTILEDILNQDINDDTNKTPPLLEIIKTEPQSEEETQVIQHEDKPTDLIVPDETNFNDSIDKNVPTLDYFYNKFKTDTSFQYSKTVVKEWLEMLKIKYELTDDEPESKKLKSDKLHHDTIKLLYKWEDEFYQNQKLPSLNYFAFKLKERKKNVCCRTLLKKWLRYARINFNPNCRVKPNCSHYSPHQPSANIIQILREINKEFHNIDDDIPVSLLKSLDQEFKKNNEIPTLDFIHKSVLSSKVFPKNGLYSRNMLKDWLFKLQISFKDGKYAKRDFLVKKLYKTKAPPTLDYFYTNLNKKNYICSKITLQKWLNILGIRYETSGEVQETKKRKKEVTLSTNIINYLLKLEEQFYQDKEELLKILKQIETQYKIKDETPSIYSYYLPVAIKNHFNTFSISKVINVLDEFNISYTLLDSKLSEAKANCPTLDYFYENLTKKGFSDFSLTELYMWLKYEGVNIQSNDIKPTTVIKNLPLNLETAIHEIYYEYRLNDLIKRLKELTSKNKPRTYQKFLEVIKQQNVFETDSTQKPFIKKWLTNLGISFVEKSRLRTPVGTLDYFYAKIIAIKGNICTKDTLANWLHQSNIKFKESKNFVPDSQINEVKRNIVKVLKKIALYYKWWDMEHTFKQIEAEFISKNTVPSFDYLHEELVKRKKEKYTKMEVQDWLNYLGIKYDKSEEKKKNKSLKKCNQCQTNKKIPETENLEIQEIKLPETEIIEIEDDDEMFETLKESEVNQSNLKDTTNIIQKIIETQEKFLPIKENSAKIRIKNPEELQIITNPNTLAIQETNTAKPNKKLQQNKIREINNDKIQLVKASKQTKKNPTCSSSNEDSNPIPNYVMKIFTDIEYKYYRMKKKPSLNVFYEAVVVNVGNNYDKKMITKWLQKTGIKFVKE